MRRVIAYTILVLTLLSCTLYQEQINKDLSTPHLEVRITPNEDIYLYAFNSSDTLVNILHINAEVNADTLATILQDVEPGEYRVLGFKGFAQYEQWKVLEPLHSTIADVELNLKNSAVLSAHDTLLYSDDTFEVYWTEDEILHKLSYKEAYYNVEITIIGDDDYDFWHNIANFSLEFRKVSSSIRYNGVWDNARATYSITEFSQSGEVAASLVLPRFTDENRVELHYISSGYSLGSFIVLPSRYSLSTTESESQTMHIELRVEPYNIHVKINGWDAGTFQTNKVGW